MITCSMAAWRGKSSVFEALGLRAMLLTYEKKTIAAIIHDENRDRFHEAVHKPNEMEVSVGVKIKISCYQELPESLKLSGSWIPAKTKHDLVVKF